MINKEIFLGVFGFRKYGVHLNGYVIGEDGTWRMWLGKRSKTKQTFPGMYDNLVSKRFDWDYKFDIYFSRLQVVSVMI